MAWDSFHEATRRWFADCVGDPTSAQRRGWESIAQGRHTLIAAPTGSGKTLAAFLAALDDLVQEGVRTPLPDEVRVVYVSPLKALSADIHKNLSEPRRGIRLTASEMGFDAPRITAAVRTGDTPQAERAAMLRKPPHLLVTTPESLYLLLTAERSREMLKTVRTVIVDEIHAVIGTRRGAHLALSLERLQQVAERPLVRIGLSATQKPIADVARFLVGTESVNDRGEAACAIVDEGHHRAMDLSLELPGSSLEAVMAHEVWEEYYDRLAALISSHKTTLVFVNTRRMAERMARHLSERLGEEAVTAHHGSLSKEKRLDAECRLKEGRLKALVATASLELGIDIGHVDLVCQIGSPHRIATLLQRIGRSGHSISGVPRGRLFPTSRDDLIECVALLRSVRRGELDRILAHDAPLDVLTQQVVAETACREYADDELFGFVRRAWPYRDLERGSFDDVVRVAGEGFATRRGRRSALVHHDEVNRRIRARRGARLLAITSGGAIPEVADYRVVLDPGDTFIGTVNEDFAVESMAGDIFQLGNASWQVLQVGPGVVRVADAKGAPPNIPFWLGEAPARSDELSKAVSDLRADVRERLDDESERKGSDPFSQSAAWLADESGIPSGAAEQAIGYFADGYRALGAIPTQQTLVLERFFDESGGMQLVLHAPFGSRINKAWGLALRKRFCRQFNFELQAAATEDALLLSLGPQHSFPLSDVFRYLHPATTRDVLVQALLDAPLFQTRWRWNTTISLAVPRNRNGRKVPPQLQRTLADDLLAAVFPDAAACLENIPGDRQIPDHPLVAQTLRDCLEEAMDFEGLAAVLSRIHAGELTLVSRDTPEPSAFAHEILTARPYAFLDDAPLEERRAQAVYARRATDPRSGNDLGALDASAIERVREEAAPDPRDEDELHDALMTTGFLTPGEASRFAEWMARLLDGRRVALVQSRVGNTVSADGWYVAAERLPELLGVHPGAAVLGGTVPPPGRAARLWTRDEAAQELIRSRMTVLGPTSAAALASSIGIDPGEADAALLALESDGAVLRGSFTPGSIEAEWCDRTLLARIHRYTLNRLRAEIEPVSPSDFMRFLFIWQHVHPSSRLTGADGLRALVSMLDGYELAAGAWERDVLPARMERYDPALLDTLCLTGDVGWARLSSGSESGGNGQSIPRVLATTPIALFRREHAHLWLTVRRTGDSTPEDGLSEDARRVAERLRQRGASFLRELEELFESDDHRRDGRAVQTLRAAVCDLVASGIVASDGFEGVRDFVDPVKRRTAANGHGSKAGRWALLAVDDSRTSREAAIEAHARALLRRYGVVFRRLLWRETTTASWRDLTRVYRRLEARGEIRGGRFVSGMSGEQFALPDAVERLREIRRTPPDGRMMTLSAADPLNLAGVVTAGDRVRAVATNHIVYRDGVPITAIEGEVVRSLLGEQASVDASGARPASVSAV